MEICLFGYGVLWWDEELSWSTTLSSFRVIMKGLIPFPDPREKVKEDFLDLFPDKFVYAPPEDLLKQQK